jgi:hypothetical protein
MTHRIAGRPLILALVPLAVLCGACAHQSVPPATAGAQPAQPVPTSAASGTPDRGVTARQALAPKGLSEATSTMDLGATPGEPATGTTKADEDLTQAARHALLGDTELQHCSSLQVTAVGGKVTIRGTVETALQRLSAVATVAAVPGVYEVHEELTVTQPPEAPLPPVVADTSATGRPGATHEHANLVAR